MSVFWHHFNLYQLSVAFIVETSHLFCGAKQLTGVYMKLNTGLKRIKRERDTISY